MADLQAYPYHGHYYPWDVQKRRTYRVVLGIDGSGECACGSAWGSPDDPGCIHRERALIMAERPGTLALREILEEWHGGRVYAAVNVTASDDPDDVSEAIGRLTTFARFVWERATKGTEGERHAAERRSSLLFTIGQTEDEAIADALDAFDGIATESARKLREGK